MAITLIVERGIYHFNAIYMLIAYIEVHEDHTAYVYHASLMLQTGIDWTNPYGDRQLWCIS